MQTLKERLVSNPKLSTKLLRSIGDEFGCEMAQKIAAKSLDGVVRELAAYWATNMIGRIEWVDKEKRIIRIEDYEQSVENSPNINHYLCPFKKGYLEAILRTKLGGSFKIREVRSQATTNKCAFRIDT